jgi:hypothetical protein
MTLAPFFCPKWLACQLAEANLTPVELSHLLCKFSTHFYLTCYIVLVSNNTKVTASAEPPRKGIRKVNLSDLSGSLSKRGRERYTDPELQSALVDAMSDGESFIWDTAVVSGKTDKALTASKAMWRSRAMSVFTGIAGNETQRLRIQWTDANEMVLTVYSA